MIHGSIGNVTKTDLLCTYVEWRSISAAASRVNSYEEQGAIMCPHERHAIAVTGVRVRRPPRAHDACACYDRSHHSRAGRGCGTADDVIVFVRGTACPVLRVWPRGRHDLRLPATAAEESICTTTYNPARDGRARALPLGVVRTSTRFTSYKLPITQMHASHAAPGGTCVRGLNGP